MQRLDSEIATHRNRIEFNRQRAQELAELIDRARRDIAEAENKRHQQEAQIKQTNSSIAEIEQHLKEKEAELTELSALAGEIHKKRSDRVTRLQELQLALSKSESRISALEEELTGTKARRELTHAQVEQLLKEIEALTEARDRTRRANRCLAESRPSSTARCRDQPSRKGETSRASGTGSYHAPSHTRRKAIAPGRVASAE